LKKQLSHIAKLISGIYLKPDYEGEVYFIQANHFNNGDFDPLVKPEIIYNYDLQKHLLIPGDVLLAGKGSSNFAVHYKGIIKQAIASSTFIVIRIFDQTVLMPEFLCWYLNHPQTQLFFKDQSRGTDILSLTIRSIKDLPVFIPDIKKQETILKLDELRKDERTLRTRIELTRENLLQQQLLQSIKK